MMTKKGPPDAAGFNHHDATQMQDPYPFYATVRSRCPIARSDQLGGFYYAVGYDETKRVFQDHQTFSSADGTALPKQPMALYPEDLDPPQQTKYRKLLNPRFTVEAVAAYRGKLRAMVDACIDGFVARGEAELQDELIRPVLAHTVMPMLGVPLADLQRVASAVDYVNRNRTLDPQGAVAKGGELAACLLGLISARRAEGAQADDILALLLAARLDEQPLADMDIFSILMILLFGGLDTTTAALGEGIRHLACNPQDAERLRRGEVSYAQAIEEFVRFTSPVQVLRRTVREETEIAGCPLHPGDFVMAMSGAANHDPARFERPDEIVIDREIEEHLGFGAGAHICLGRNFARLAMEVILRAVLARLPDLRLAEGFTPEYAVGEARGMKTLQVSFTPATAGAA